MTFTRLQLIVLMHLDDPFTLRQLAYRLHMNFWAFDGHLNTVYRKLGVHDRISATREWEKLGS